MTFLCIYFLINRIPDTGIYTSLKYVGTFQIYIESIIAKLVANKEISIDYLVSPMHTPTYKASSAGAAVSSIKISMYFIICTAILMVMLITRMQIEKNMKIREFMRIMGMSDTTYYLSYIISYMITGLITSLIMTACLRILYLGKTNVLILFIEIYLIVLNGFTYTLVIK